MRGGGIGLCRDHMWSFPESAPDSSWRLRVIIEPPTTVDGGNFALLRTSKRLQFAGLKAGWCEFSSIHSSTLFV